MHNDMINEINDMIKEINEITTRTDIINKEYSIQPSNREILKMDTNKLKDISNRMKKISILLDDERLRNIGEEIGILVKNREIRDNQKYLSKDSYYDEFTGKQNKSSTERLEQEANIELLKELNEEVKERTNELEQQITRKKEQQEQLLKNIKSVQIKEKNLKEIKELSKQLPINFQISITKEMIVKGIIELNNSNIEMIPDLKQLQELNKEDWKTLKKKLENTELIISSNLIDQEEKESLQKEANDIKSKIDKCVEYGKIYHAINKKIEETAIINEQIPKELTEQEAIKELEDYNHKIEEEQIKSQTRIQEEEKKEKIRKQQEEQENKIIESMKNIPESLRITLGIKLENANLLTPNIDKIIFNKEKTSESEVKESIEEYKNKLLESNQKIKENNQKIIEENQKYNTLTIEQYTKGLSPELLEYKEKLKSYIGNLKKEVTEEETKIKKIQTITRYYNQADKLITELINSKNSNSIEMNSNSLPVPQDDYFLDEEISLEDEKKFWEEDLKLDLDNIISEENNLIEIKNNNSQEKIADLETPDFLNWENSIFKNNEVFKTEEHHQEEILAPKVIELPDNQKETTEDDEYIDIDSIGKDNIPQEDEKTIIIEPTNVEKKQEDTPPPKRETEDKKSTLEKAKNKLKSIITKVRKPKKDIRLRKIKNIAKLATAIFLIGVAASNMKTKNSTTEIKEEQTASDTTDTNEITMEVFDENGNSQEIITTSLEDDTINENTENLVDMTPIDTTNENTDSLVEMTPVEELNKITEDSPYTSLGKDIIVNDNSPIYKNAYNAYLEDEGMTPYFESNEERKVIGLAFWNDEIGLKTVYNYHENSDEMIKNIVNDGGELVAVLTQVKDKKGSFEPEGWYSLNDIAMAKQLEKGVHR